MAETLLETWADQSPEHARLYAQEGLILEVTEAIWEAMGRRGWNKRQLADALGRSPAYVTQILNGGRNMTLRTLSDIAAALGVSVHVALTESIGENSYTWKPMEYPGFSPAKVPVKPNVILPAMNEDWDTSEAA